MSAGLTLASQSPRRAELLRQLGVSFTIQPAHVDETPHAGELPAAYVQRLAREKAEAVQALGEHCVLAADTTVVIDGDTLGKPVDDDQARAMLTRLSGRRHSVYSAVCISVGGRSNVRCVETVVHFCVLSPRLIEAYIASGEPHDKAGAYGIQGLASAFIRGIEGSPSNVVGLPLLETRWLLEDAGIPTALDGRLPGDE